MPLAQNNCIIDFNNQTLNCSNTTNIPICAEQQRNLQFSEYILPTAFSESNPVVNLNDEENFSRYNAQGNITTTASQSLEEPQQRQTILQLIKSVFKRPQIFPDVYFSFFYTLKGNKIY